MKRILKVILSVILIILLLNSVKEKSIEIYQKNKIKDNIYKIELGKIEIPSITLNNKIVSGTNKNILDQNYVGHIKESSLNFNETIILAGHNNKYVFKRLKELKRGNKIYLTIYDETKKYCVLNKIEIYYNDYTYFKKQENTLILITCTKDKNKRLIIISKLCM